MYQHGVKSTLKAGSALFGLSALFLLIDPKLFLDLLGISDSKELSWAMRMIAITLIALAGNMWQNSKLNNAAGLRFVGRIMFGSALALGLLTIFIPASLTPFAIGYAAVGLTFAASYFVNLIRK